MPRRNAPGWRPLRQLAVPEAHDFDVLGRLGAQIGVGGLDRLKDARNLIGGGVHLLRIFSFLPQTAEIIYLNYKSSAGTTDYRGSLAIGQNTLIYLGDAEDGLALQRGNGLVVLLRQLIAVAPRRQCHRIVIPSRATAALHSH